MTDEAAPFADTRRARAHRAWRSAETIKGLSDRLIGLGPFGLGLDGVLSWVPVVGPLYSMGAGGLLLIHGLSAGASFVTLARMLAYVAMDTATDAVPIAGSVVDMMFPGHLMAAKALQKDIEARHGLPDDVALKRAPKKRAKAGKR
ncbi:DUF4112 domain-containing protein [Caulobacter henricii]|uniref:DUF4112 domain-containing protein n=1 Tax=Caulobacter henricii TaxID=69395 RepID=A0A0P0NXN0_9CAUL|nr:DUF4112 domain-containing protein [Caulobacter henricii]ALL12851.1 hypothetical protein AQ619_05485 [Caulobacter henricii]